MVTTALFPNNLQLARFFRFDLWDAERFIDPLKNKTLHITY